MLTFSPAQFEQLTQDTFFKHLEDRIADEESEFFELSAPDRLSLWDAAKQAERFGIKSIRACLVLCHIFWEMGIDCIERVPAFAEIMRDAKATEDSKVEAMWLLRTQFFAALRKE